MSGLKIGFTTVDITPPVGTAMAGYGSRDRGAAAIEAPLLCHALVAESDGSYAALAFTDLIGITPEIITGVREQVSRETEIPGDAVTASGSHTHWGPELRHESYLSDSVNALVQPEYVDCLTRTIAGAIAAAWREREPALAGAGVGLADGISYNRRPVNTCGETDMRLVLPPEQAMVAANAGLRMRRQWKRGGYGGPQLSPPLENVDGLRAGVSDPRAPLLKLLRADGQPLGAVVNFACHPVIGGDDNMYAISPDYPGEARKAFESVVGAPLGFGLGCAGDQVPAWRGGDSRVRVGRSLGAAAAREWYQIQSCCPEACVRTARRQVALTVKALPTVAQAQADLEATGDPTGPDSTWQRQVLDMARRFEGKPGLETELCAVRIGDWAAVAVPGEVLVEIGLQIKQLSPFEVTAVISCANDAVGYISTANAHREGGYEPTWSPAGPQAEGQLVDTALELLGELAD